MSTKRSSKQRRKSAQLGALPLTSMIDVVFLLLIFFLVTANFSKQEHKLPATLQTEGGGVRSSDLQPQILQIRLQNSNPIFVMGEVVVDNRDSLEAFLSGLPKEPGVAIRSEPDVPISAIAVALQAARNAGFQKRSYVPSDSQ
ncbi:MAG: biopolymer transporter ExbD [Phycisphaerales bacterium]|jgi:biopolymer transport protein ExbD|nr:biopolymer transporter ExbD [Phycisphaerales bacterium]